MDAKLYTFHTPLAFLSVEFGIIGYCDPGRLPSAGSQDTDLSCLLLIFTFVALCDHKPPTLQTDGRTDVMLVA